MRPGFRLPAAHGRAPVGEVLMIATVPLPEPPEPYFIRSDSSLGKAREALLSSWQIPDQHLQEAAIMLETGRMAEARRNVSRHLANYPMDPDALNLIAHIAEQEGRLDEAERSLAISVQVNPDIDIYRYNYAALLAKVGKVTGALSETEILLQKCPDNILYINMMASLLSRTEKYHAAAVLYRKLVCENPDAAEFWIGLAGTLRSLGGHAEECERAFRTAIEIEPSLGTAWWKLASMRTVRFTKADVQVMEDQLQRTPFSAEQRASLHYALGKAYGDTDEYEKSFRNYSRGNAIKRIGMNYDADETTLMVSRAEATFTPSCFQRSGGAGCDSNAPIFVLGLQRAGSTLVEQILGSHSSVEAAGELQCVLRVVGNDVMPKTGPDYPNGMDRLDTADLRSFGEKYLALSAAKRRLGRPFFVDKCPFNLWHVGLIHLMLPNAKIIDARRHPMGCCFANFTMTFPHAPPVSYRLSDMGRFYADYVRLMAHFDKALPGKIHRVIYEHLVADTETVVRRLLDFLDLPFESGCLEYYKNDRAFNSYSNEQVRRPIFKDGVERWRNYEPWLGALKSPLGPVLDAYPDVPEFDS
jgi:tetratricopeptide (TPR) repeat protein